MELDKYFRIPYETTGASFEGANCWGLVSLVYKEELGKTLPVYDTNAEDKIRVEENVLEAQQSNDWTEIKSPTIKEYLCVAQPFDVILLRIRGLPWHIGVYLGEGRFLHTLPRLGVTAPELNSMHWRNRFLGAYRWNKI